ncbi:Hypothetical_protein [Hexamita inflata]|uniref:Hypothetical_protein n=1 Tax=Hexamita inflata TaxID=28002 RepID=A0AA86QYG4_9EUKA|nr:Hypothetical protein HINF_LOCUS54560 [Hexamita inflata]
MAQNQLHQLNSCVRSSKIFDEFHFSSSQQFNDFNKMVITAKQKQSYQIYQLRNRLKQLQTTLNVNSMEELQFNKDINAEINNQIQVVKEVQEEFKQKLLLTVEEARKQLQVIIS